MAGNMQKYEIDMQFDDNLWKPLPRRFDNLKEAVEIAKGIVELYSPHRMTVAIRFRKIGDNG